MIEIRIHGRGGQGNVVAAYLMAAAAFDSGFSSQAFPAFGAERRGAPVVAFVRIDEKPISRRSQVREPAYLIIQDEHLLHEHDLTAGLLPGGGVLINSTRSSEALAEELGGLKVVAIPATAMALETVGRPVPNVALLAAFLQLTGLLPQEGLIRALEERFSGDILEKNRKLAELAVQKVPAGLWKEAQHATGA
ncbi:MAG TPA: 2-oxoacid:acceptor oxidoreductase family protein [Mariprofundaceae bacterium]|nr:2-oxoacid:acceptor oxidoreductase family protein [Mariprofundaceae bacterium]